MEKEQVLAIRNQLREKLEEGNSISQVGEITYYSDFEIVQGDDKFNAFSEKNVFIVARQVEKDGLKLNYFEIYDEKMVLLATTDEQGKMMYSEDYQKKLAPMKQYLGLDKREMYLNEDKEEDELIVNDKPKNELEEKDVERNKEKAKEQSEKKVKEPDPALMEKDLGLNKKSIKYCQQITDERFFDLVPESKDFGRTAFVIYSEETGKFMVVGLKDGKNGEKVFEPYRSIDSGMSTFKRRNDLGRDGSSIKDQEISGILRYRHNEEFDFAVNIKGNNGQGIQVQELRKDIKTGKYISADLRTDVQKSPTYPVTAMMKPKENESIREEISKLDFLREKLNKENIRIEDIEDNPELEKKIRQRIEEAKKKAQEPEKDDEDDAKGPWDGDPRRSR